MSEVKRVYKFYDAEYGIINLAAQHLKISLFDDLNDPFEAQFISFSGEDSRQSFKLVLRKFYADKGLICFSDSWYNPVIWSHYADKHKGIALGFDVPVEHLLKVSYRKQRLPYPGILDKSAAQAFQFVEKALTTKFKHWEYENEYRTIASLEEKGANSEHYFKPFADNLKLREVILGPASKLTSAEILTSLNGQSEPKIITTRLAFSSYRIVRQKAPNFQV